MGQQRALPSRRSATPPRPSVPPPSDGRPPAPACAPARAGNRRERVSTVQTRIEICIQHRWRDSGYVMTHRVRRCCPKQRRSPPHAAALHRLRRLRRLPQPPHLLFWRGRWRIPSIRDSEAQLPQVAGGAAEAHVEQHRRHRRVHGSGYRAAHGRAPPHRQASAARSTRQRRPHRPGGERGALN